MLNRSLGTMSEDDASASRAFFDITAEDVNQESPSSPPQPILVGGFDAGFSSPDVSPASTDTLESPQSATVAPSTGHLSGQISTLSGGGLAFAPAMEKKTQGWGRFFIGVVAPWIVIGFFTLLFIFIESTNEYETSENISFSADENGTVNFQLSPPSPSHSVRFYVSLTEDNIMMDYDPYWNGEASSVPVIQYGYESSRYRETSIGEYTPSTGEVSFTSVDLVNQSFETDVWYHDEDYAGEDGAAFVFSCCLPILYLGSVIAAFVRGEKRLGWGLLTSLVGGAFLVPLVFLFIAWVIFGGGF
ncbi:MAG: hypothetical protein DWC07_03160 [Candidatus Poseidoniales archaeon]|nr:MAG: hypothetical protein DWC07_03160 [Candidatus Poseidoniales archaeon]